MKKILNIIIVILLFLGLNINAGTDTKDRTKLPNYGVNKNWKISDSNKNDILDTYAVDASEKIYDFSNILTSEEEKILKNKIDMFIKKYKTDVVILTDNLEYSYDYINENYAVNFYDYNDFGMDYNNSGIVLFRNTYSEDPYYDIYIFGDAQLYISSERANATLDNVYDYLHGRNYLDGFSKFIDDITMYYDQGIPRNMQKYEVDENGYLVKKYTIPWIQAIGISLGITFIIMFILIKKNKMVYEETKANQYINKQTSYMTNKRDVFLSTNTRSYAIDSGGSTSRGGSFRGSSGGGHSSGGGRHG